MMAILWSLATLFLGVTVLGIEVAPNSPCSNLCIDKPGLNISSPHSSSTQTWDLVCEDEELNGASITTTGRKWVNCIGCESTSSANSAQTRPAGENDVYWFLFNIKFTIDWCVYGYPNNNNVTPAMDSCSGTCQPVILPLTDNLLETNMTLQYDYCTSRNGSFTSTVDSCIQCLEGVSGAKTLANYLRAMDIACQQEPSPGTALNLSFNVFNVNHNPTTTTTSPSSGSPAATASLTPATATVPGSGNPDSINSNSSSANPTISNTGGRSNNSDSVKIGVGIGVSLGVVFLAGALFFIYRWRRRRSQSMQAAFQTGPRLYVGPGSQGPLPEMEGYPGHKRQRWELDGTTSTKSVVSQPREVVFRLQELEGSSPGSLRS